MTREQKYDAVNETKSLEALAKVIKYIADENGIIQGRSRQFNASKMATACREYPFHPKNTLTREFGIRQQAMMIEYYYH